MNYDANERDDGTETEQAEVMSALDFAVVGHEKITVRGDAGKQTFGTMAGIAIFYHCRLGHRYPKDEFAAAQRQPRQDKARADHATKRHGLGHIALHHPEPARSMIDAFLAAKGARVPDDLRRYAYSAREGGVQ